MNTFAPRQRLSTNHPLPEGKALGSYDSVYLRGKDLSLPGFLRPDSDWARQIEQLHHEVREQEDLHVVFLFPMFIVALLHWGQRRFQGLAGFTAVATDYVICKNWQLHCICIVRDSKKGCV